MNSSMQLKACRKPTQISSKTGTSSSQTSAQSKARLKEGQLIQAHPFWWLKTPLKMTSIRTKKKPMMMLLSSRKAVTLKQSKQRPPFMRRNLRWVSCPRLATVERRSLSTLINSHWTKSTKIDHLNLCHHALLNLCHLHRQPKLAPSLRRSLNEGERIKQWKSTVDSKLSRRS